MGVLYVISNLLSASTAIALASKEKDDVSILLIGEARTLVDDRGQRRTLGHTGKIYCLDGIAKGRSKIKGVEVLDYSGWVTLIEESERIVSWT